MAALPKQALDIPFGVGLDTKTDQYRVAPGKMIALENSIFTVGGQLTKRHGFDELPTLDADNVNSLATFEDSLTAIGTRLYNLSPETSAWYDKGTITSVRTGVDTLVRSATSQSQQDSAVAPNGLICTVWRDSAGVSKYNVVDASSGQAIVPITSLAATATVNRVFVLGNYFIITFLATVSAASHLQYIALPLTNPNNPSVATDLATDAASLTIGYDAYVANNSLYFAYGTSTPAIKVTKLSSTLVLSSALTIAARTSTKMSVTADTSTPTPTIWLTYFDGTNNNLYASAISASLVAILAPTVIVASTASINQVTSTAASGSLLAIYQRSATYSYSTGIETDFVSKISCTVAGVVSGGAVVARGVALGSKAFILNSTTYLMAAYGSNDVDNDNYQPTYFLMDTSGNVIAKLAYSNGGGYPSNQVLPQGNVDDLTLKIGYLFKDLLTSVNKSQGVANTSGIYTQTGINLATFELNTVAMQTAEIGGALHLGGGFLWMYDGVKPVEHGFHLWPEDIFVQGVSTVGALSVQQYFYVVTYEWTDAAGNVHRSAPSVPQSFTITTAPANFTADRTSGSAVLANVSSLTGLQVGQVITGTGIPGSTYILSIDSATQITMSANATSGAASSTIITPTTLTSVTVDIPTLRLTYKTSPNAIRIVVYRWSVAQQNYYQITSVSSPTLNDPTTDSIAYVDSASDASILGNQLLYTTGGVVENIAAPAATDVSLYKSRFFLIDAEDENLLWYSKQVIEATPVEMSDLFTLYVAPTMGVQGSTGKTKCITAMDDKNIFFKANAIYYNTGDGPDNTGANNDFTTPTFITSTVGCDNPASIIFIPQGLMFQSSKGIWLLGRDLSTSYIGAPVQVYNDATVLSAVSVPGTNQVRFNLDTGVVLMYDYYYDQWGTFNNISAISSVLYQELHTYLKSDGMILQQSEGYLDGSHPVCRRFTTAWFSMAGLQGYERAYYFYLLGNYISPHRLQIDIAYDYNPAISQTAYVLPDNFNPTYGEAEGGYGSGTYGGNSTVEQWRIFFEKQKCQSFQITVTEMYDPSYGVAAGEGFTLSGINLVVGTKKKYAPLNPTRSTG